MKVFDGVAEAAGAAQRLVLLGATGLPGEIADKLAPLAGLGGSPVALIVGFAEAVYANSDAAAADAKEVAAGCAIFAESLNFHGLADGARGTKIARMLRGDALPDAPPPKAEWQVTPPQPASAEIEALLASEAGAAALAAWQAAQAQPAGEG